MRGAPKAAVYNHYQRVQELVRREEEAAEALAKRQRREALETFLRAILTDDVLIEILL
jgi:predicted DNA-binding protein YlxM (UPF0122 family)